MTSVLINKIIPYFRFFLTLKVWRPWNISSRETSRNHKKIINPPNIKENKKFIILFFLKKNNNLEKNLEEKQPTIKGQGLLSTN